MNYLFAVGETDGMIFAVVVQESYFRRKRGVSRDHISQSQGGSMPDILGWDEEVESYFLPWRRHMTTMEAHDDLIAKGLQFDARLATHVEQCYDGEIYRP